MTKTLKLVSTVAIGLILISVTIAVFFLGQRTSLELIALLFVLLSEIAFMACLLYLTLSNSPSNKRIIHMGMLSTLSAYWLASVLLALFNGMFAQNKNIFTLVNLIFISLAAIICLVLNLAATKVAGNDRATSNQILFLQDIEDTLFGLKSNTAYADFALELNALYEKIKFSDKVGISTFDQALSTEVSSLKTALTADGQNTKNAVTQSITEITLLIKQRNMALSQNKKGGF